MSHHSQQFILASGSQYRRATLAKVLPDFSCQSPDIDESQLANETVEQMIKRLSLQKAQAVVKDHPNAIVIASDQSAEFDGQALGKAGNFQKAFEQLKQQQGKTITFYTGLVVYDPIKEVFHQDIDQTFVHFRQLSDLQIKRYLEIEQPYDCAGSFKSEGLGIILFDKLETEDPNALVGLPLIRLIKHLDKIGIKLPL